LADRLGRKGRKGSIVDDTFFLSLGHTQARAPWRADRGQRALVLADDGAGSIRARYIGAPLVRLPHASVRRALRGILRHVAREIPRPVNAEVNAQPERVIELEKHLLTHRAGFGHRATIENGSALGESTLRRAGQDALTNKVARELPRNAMNGMTFGHGLR